MYLNAGFQNIGSFFRFNYIFDLLEISRADCKRHLTSSVGQRTNEAKKAAAEPASAFSNELRLFVSCFLTILQIPF
jgi:hypothetical protein